MNEYGDGVTAVPDDAIALSASSVYDLLADRDRRRLIEALGELDTPERLTALTRSIAMARDEPDVADIDWIYVRLYHTHVPKLEACGVVEYDPEEDTLVLTRKGRSLVDTLEESDL